MVYKPKKLRGKKMVYYVDYYDMNDGWLGFDYLNEFRKDRIFTDYDEAMVCQEKLNSEMSFGNIRCGEYYDVKHAVPIGVPVGPVEA